MEKTSYLIYFISVFMASAAQILLKKSADAQNKSFLKKFLNAKVLIAYIILFTSLFINTIALKHVDLKFVPFITSTSFIWILLLSFAFLKERPSNKKVIGAIIIIIGVVISRL